MHDAPTRTVAHDVTRRPQASVHDRLSSPRKAGRHRVRVGDRPGLQQEPQTQQYAETDCPSTQRLRQWTRPSDLTSSRVSVPRPNRQATRSAGGSSATAPSTTEKVIPQVTATATRAAAGTARCSETSTARGAVRSAGRCLPCSGRGVREGLSGIMAAFGQDRWAGHQRPVTVLRGANRGKYTKSRDRSDSAGPAGVPAEAAEAAWRHRVESRVRPHGPSGRRSGPSLRALTGAGGPAGRTDRTDRGQLNLPRTRLTPECAGLPSGGSSDTSTTRYS